MKVRQYMGNRNTHPGADQVKSSSSRGPVDLIERFDDHLADLCYDSRSEAFRDFLSRELGEHRCQLRRPSTGAGEQQKLYRELLRGSNDRLIDDPQRRASELANGMDTTKDELGAAIFPRRRHGYVRRWCGHPGSDSNVYRGKPMAADPNLWKYREAF